MAAISKKAAELLESIGAAGDNGTYVSPKDVATLVKNGLVEVNEGMTDADGNVAARLTQKGKDSMTQTNETSATATGTPAVSAPVAGIPMPKQSRPNRPEMYPFDALQVGESFFVAATGDRPEPAKSIGSTVASANKRYAEETGNMTTNRRGREVPELRQLRRFIVRSVDDGAPWGEQFAGVAGAAVYRVEVE